MTKLLLPCEAAKLIHPSVKEASVRTMMRNGAIVRIQIGAAHYTTHECVTEYLTCHDQQNLRGSFSGKSETARKSGSSSTVDAKSGPDVLKATLQALKTS
jgi:hypothetical protein